MTPRTVVVFRSSAFNTTEERDYFINPGCFGDDLGRWLLDRLRALGAEVDDEPGAEDFGWYINFSTGGIGYCLVIGFRPGDEEAVRGYVGDQVDLDVPPDEPGEWICVLERDRGLIGSMLGRRNRGIGSDAADLVHQALSGTEEISHLRWHDRQDFDRGDEGRSTAGPSGR